MKNNIKQLAKDYLLILAGTFILALGVNIFLAPNKLSAGGVTSLATVLLHLFKIKISVTNLVVNAILFVLGYKYLGKQAVLKTAAGIVFCSFSYEITSYIPPYTDDIFIAMVAGAVLMGAGVGLVVKQEGSTGGSDFAALILRPFFPHISLAYLILFIDFAIIVMSGIVFKSLNITLYSAILLFLSAKVTDIIITMGDSAKSLQIISEHSSEIAEKIMEQFERGVTGIHCKGMYSAQDGLMLLCVVSPKQLPAIVHIIRRIDKSAFIVINDAKEVFGEGFKIETEYDKIQ